MDLWRALAERFRGERLGGGLQPAQRVGRPDGGSSARSTTGWWRRSARSTPTTSSSSTATRTRRTSRSSSSRTRTRSTRCTTTRRRHIVRWPVSGYPGRVGGRDARGDLPRAHVLLARDGTPIWVGEFGPVYTGAAERDEQRYQVLCDQLEIYDRYSGGAGRSGPTRTSARTGWSSCRPGRPVHGALRRPDRQEAVAQGRRLGLDARRDPEVIEPLQTDRARVPGLGAVPVGRARGDRPARPPHPVRAGDAAGVRRALPRARRRRARRAGRPGPGLARSCVHGCVCATCPCSTRSSQVLPDIVAACACWSRSTLIRLRPSRIAACSARSRTFSTSTAMYIIHHLAALR